MFGGRRGHGLTARTLSRIPGQRTDCANGSAHFLYFRSPRSSDGAGQIGPIRSPCLPRRVRWDVKGIEPGPEPIMVGEVR